MIERNDIPLGSTYDSNGNQLSYKNSGGYWEEYTYDDAGKVLTYKDSDRYWSESTYGTYGSNGKVLTFKTSYGENK